MNSDSGGISGAQRPRLELIPEAVSSAGDEAVELAAASGLVLDDWEAYVLANALGERSDGRWAAFEVGLCIPRQNGKGAILEARELAGLFLLRERLIIHTAHLFDTSLEAFRRLLSLIEDNPDFSREVKKVSQSHGEEGIEMLNGQRIRFRTRTKVKGGRGFSADCLILDEAMFLPESSHAALLPTLSARPNPQVWYTGSAVDQSKDADGVVFSRVRHRGINGGERLAYFEWSVDAENPGMLSDAEAESLDAWAVSNPGLGIRISPEHIDSELGSLGPREFRVERLNVGDWPDPDGVGASVIDMETWNALGEAGTLEDPVAFALDVSPDRAWASIAAAGHREDGEAQVEIVEHKRGTSWVVARAAELTEAHEHVGWVCDASGPAASLLYDLQAAGVNVTAATVGEHGQACGQFFDSVDQGSVHHLGSEELRRAVKGASTRPLGDAWAWSRKNSSVDISPLVASTLALWMFRTQVVEEGFVIAF